MLRQYDRSLVRMAKTIEEKLSKTHVRGESMRYRVDRLSEQLRYVMQKIPSLRRAVSSPYARAGRTVMQRQMVSVSTISSQCLNLQKEFTSISLVSPPTIASVYEDLLEIQEAFGRIQYHAPTNVLSTVTDRIELEGIDLGHFRLDLYLDNLNADPSSFISAKALDPNPAREDSSYVHPHVDGESICLGDAINPLKSAAQTFRLADIMTITNVTLNTYNASSAYAKLCLWGQEEEYYSCDDCGAECDEDDTYGCAECENYSCGDCINMCEACSNSLCRNCTISCQICGAIICSRCEKICAGDSCGRSICPSCYDYDSLCDDCIRKANEEDEDKDEDEDEYGINDEETTNTGEDATEASCSTPIGAPIEWQYKLFEATQGGSTVSPV